MGNTLFIFYMAYIIHIFFRTFHSPSYNFCCKLLQYKIIIRTFANVKRHKVFFHTMFLS